jgi:hypothetical protein
MDPQLGQPLKRATGTCKVTIAQRQGAILNYIQPMTQDPEKLCPVRHKIEREINWDHLRQSSML